MKPYSWPDSLTAKQILDLFQRIPLHVDRTSTSLPVSRSHFHFPLGRKAKDNTVGFPSSLDHKSSIIPGLRDSDPLTAASIKYELQFRFYRGDTLIADTTRKVCIFDCNESAPPICVEDFGSEYSAKTVASLRRNLFQKVGTITIEATQPSPFVFMTGADSATTGVPIRAFLRSKANATELVNGPNKVEVDVSWRLQTSTFVSMFEFTGRPTVSAAERSHSLVRLVSTGKAQHDKIYWSGWSPSRQSGESSNDGTIDYTVEDTVWLSLPSSSLLAPTTSLRLISRRYCIILELKVSVSGRPRSVLKLPIQVSYQSQPANMVQDTASLGLDVVPLGQHFECNPPTLQGDCTGLPPYTAGSDPAANTAIQTLPATTKISLS